MLEKFEFVACLPGLVGVKDVNSTYVMLSEGCAKLLGWKSAFETQGKTDYDIPCQVVEFADEFVKADKKIITTSLPMMGLCIQKYSTGWKILLAERKPIKNVDSEVIGLLDTAIDITDSGLVTYYLNLYRSDNKFLGKCIKPAFYILSATHSPLPLTEKQESCLFLLIRGKTIKEIAKVLGVSPRTVECHLDAIKIKLHCQYKSQLIEKALDNGFLYYIPQELQLAIDGILQA